MANAEKVVNVVKELALPSGKFAVFGGACLALLGIREAHDIEVFVSKDCVGYFQDDLWRQTSFNGQNPHLLGVVLDTEVQAFLDWDCPGWQPNIASYFSEPEVVEGVPCMPLDELMKWKHATARPKDLRDMELVDQWQQAR
ncbi:hypothetical protein KBD20_00865 [Candidatus Saccharibacteria bacterium]|nr:hypothetical protein [Candidatus Saccharibacteria bacterium]